MKRLLLCLTMLAFFALAPVLAVPSMAAPMAHNDDMVPSDCGCCQDCDLVMASMHCCILLPDSGTYAAAPTATSLLADGTLPALQGLHIRPSIPPPRTGILL